MRVRDDAVCDGGIRGTQALLVWLQIPNNNSNTIRCSILVFVFVVMLNHKAGAAAVALLLFIVIGILLTAGRCCACRCEPGWRPTTTTTTITTCASLAILQASRSVGVVDRPDIIQAQLVGMFVHCQYVH